MHLHLLANVTYSYQFMGFLCCLSPEATFVDHLLLRTHGSLPRWQVSHMFLFYAFVVPEQMGASPSPV